MANQVTFQIKIETLGALRRFKLETGEDAEHVSSASDIAVLIWCCCKTCEKAPRNVLQNDATMKR